MAHSINRIAQASSWNFVHFNLSKDSFPFSLDTVLLIFFFSSKILRTFTFNFSAKKRAFYGDKLNADKENQNSPFSRTPPATNRPSEARPLAHFLWRSNAAQCPVRSYRCKSPFRINKNTNSRTQTSSQATCVFLSRGGITWASILLFFVFSFARKHAARASEMASYDRDEAKSERNRDRDRGSERERKRARAH